VKNKGKSTPELNDALVKYIMCCSLAGIIISDMDLALTRLYGIIPE
jgi:hypothetical protein